MMAVLAKNMLKTPPIRLMASSSRCSLPPDKRTAARPTIRATPVLNMAMPIIMALAMSMTMLLEKPEKAS